MPPASTTAASPLLDIFNPHPTPARISSGPTHVQIKSTPIQSNTPLIREFVASAKSTGINANTILVRSDCATKVDVEGVTVVSPFEDACRAEFDEAFRGCGKRWSDVVLEAVRGARPNQPTTIIIESLDCLLDTGTSTAGSSDIAQQVYKQDLLPILSALDNRSRFIFSTPISSHSIHPEAQTRLITLLSSHASSSSSPYLTLQLHPPATWRYLLAEYGSGLRPASTSGKIVHKLVASNVGATDTVRLRRTAAAHDDKDDEDDKTARIFDWDAPPWRTTDPRLWSILSRVENRSHFTTGSWWIDEVDRLNGEQIEAVSAPASNSFTTTTTFDPVENRITLADLLGPTSSSPSNKRHQDERTVSHRPRVDWGIVTCESRGGGGGNTGKEGPKYSEEVLGVVSNGQRLRLVPLEMGDYRTGTQESKTKSTATADSHLPFNLSLTSEQKARRDKVELPFAPTERIYQGISSEEPDALQQQQLRRGTTGQSTIYFEPDSADEEDEEDPDEDLDV